MYCGPASVGREATCPTNSFPERNSKLTKEQSWTLPNINSYNWKHLNSAGKTEHNKVQQYTAELVGQLDTSTKNKIGHWIQRRGKRCQYSIKKLYLYKKIQQLITTVYKRTFRFQKKTKINNFIARYWLKVQSKWKSTIDIKTRQSSQKEQNKGLAEIQL